MGTTQRLLQEHERIREALARLCRRVQDGSHSSVVDAFTRFARTVRDHLRAEDRLMQQLERSPEALRREHIAIRALLAEVARGLARPDRGGVRANLYELGRALELHHEKARVELYASLNEPADPRPPRPSASRPRGSNGGLDERHSTLH